MLLRAGAGGSVRVLLGAGGMRRPRGCVWAANGFTSAGSGPLTAAFVAPGFVKESSVEKKAGFSTELYLFFSFFIFFLFF